MGKTSETFRLSLVVSTLLYVGRLERIIYLSIAEPVSTVLTCPLCNRNNLSKHSRLSLTAVDLMDLILHTLIQPIYKQDFI